MAGNGTELWHALFGLQARISQLTNTIVNGTPEEIRTAAVERDRAVDRLAWTLDLGMRNNDIDPLQAAQVAAYIAERRAEVTKRWT